jgi:hypothetical protein
VTQWKHLTPAVAAFAAVWLVLDFAALPHESGVKKLVRDGYSPRYSYWYPYAWILRQGSELMLSLQESESAVTVGSVQVSPRRRLSGWWAPTSESFDTSVQRSQIIPLTADEWRSVESQFADYLDTLADLPPGYAQWVREGRASVTRTLWPGYVRNFFALLCALIVVGQSSFWFITFRKRRRAVRAVKQGQCLQCGYDLRGALEKGCPECGWNRSGEVRDAR